MVRIRNYEALFATDGYWRKKRAEKGKLFTDKSLQMRCGIMKNYIIPLWGNMHPKKLTIKKIDRAMLDLRSDFTGSPLAGATRNRILSVLSELYRHFIEEGRVKTNPAAQVIRYQPEPKRPRGAIPAAEMKKLFPPTHRGLKRLYGSQTYICAFLILRDTGMRPGELIALKWSDWRPDLRFFPVMKAVESGTRDHIKGTKTGSTKPAMVSGQTAAEIERLRSEQGPGPDRFMFSNRDNKPLDVHCLDRAFRRAVRAAGIDRPELTPYWLRHTFNTRALETMPDDIVRRLMGHRSPAMSRYYRHADVDSLIREAKRIRKTLGTGRIYEDFVNTNI
jgi:integrase/recombinase XerD